MVKILPLSKYKFINGRFELDLINPKRVGALFLFVLSIFSIYVSINREDLMEKLNPPQVMVEPKSKELIAIEDYISSSTKNLTPSQVQEYARLTMKYSSEHKVDPYTMIGLMKVESHFDKYAISSVGALGLTQVMPKYHKEKIKKLVARFGEFNPFNEEHNIAIGTMIFAEYSKKYKSKEKALLQYNGSLHHEEPTYAKAVLKARSHAIKFEVKT